MRHLGRLAPARNPAVPRLKALLPSLPPAPEVVCWWGDVPEWRMLGNDGAGDCTVAALGHAVMAMSAYAGVPVIPSDQDILSTYSAITGYDPTKPETDNGAVIEAVLAYAQKTGVTVDGKPHRITAFASVNPADQDEVRRAINLFGGLDVGVDLPISAQGQDYYLTCTNQGATSAPNSWGGHCVWAAGCDASGVDVISWGARYKMAWDFWVAYVVEAHAIIDPAFMTGSGVTPADVNWDALGRAMASL